MHPRTGKSSRNLVVSQFEHPVAAVYDRRSFLLIISALIERRYSKLRHYRAPSHQAFSKGQSLFESRFVDSPAQGEVARAAAFPAKPRHGLLDERAHIRRPTRRLRE